MLAAVRWWIGVLRTESTHVSAIGKFWRGLLLVPLFGVLVVCLRIRLLLRGPLRVEAQLGDGSRFRCDLPDLIQMYLYLFGLWEPDLTAYLRHALKPGDTLVDVGANVGNNSITGSHCVGQSGQVIAIEASPDLARRLEEHVRLNNAANVRVVHAAASDHEHQLTIFQGPQHNVGLTATSAHRGMKPSQRVRAQPLAQLIEDADWDRIRVIKIDVEGGEPAVLRGVAAVLQRLPADAEISVELSPEWWTESQLTPEQLITPFRERGFHLYVIPNNYWPWRYLWPNDVQAPRRYHRALPQWLKRMDLVLSRRDVEVLENS